MMIPKQDGCLPWPSWVTAMLILSTDHRTTGGAAVILVDYVSPLLWHWLLQVRVNHNMETRRLSPLVLLGDSYIDLIRGPRVMQRLYL